MVKPSSLASSGGFLHLIMQTFLFCLFLTHYTIANDLGSIQAQARENNLVSPEIYVPNDVLAETAGNSIITHVSTPEENITGELSLHQFSIDDQDSSPLAGNGNVNCNSGAQNSVDQNLTHSRFRRSSSRFSRRQNRDLCTVPAPHQLQEGAQQGTGPTGNEKMPVRPIGTKKQNISPDDLLMQIITQPYAAGQPNLEKCGKDFYRQIPICAPTEVLPVSGEVVVPARFCKLTQPPFSPKISSGKFTPAIYVD